MELEPTKRECVELDLQKKFIQIIDQIFSRSYAALRIFPLRRIYIIA